MKYLCFDVGGTFVKYALFDQQAHFLKKAKYPTPKTNAQQFFAKMASIANHYLDVEAIGLSIPGFINTETGYAFRAGALEQLDGLYLSQELQTQLKKKIPIVIENDANCAALAEKLNGNAQDSHDFAVLTLGTGVGGGIVVNDQILHGYHYRAGEFGMMLTDISRRGFATLHDLASTSALVKRYAQNQHCEFKRVSGELIMQQLDRPEVQQIIADWAKYVAVAIFNLVVTNNPQKVLIGGGISQDKRILPFIKQALAAIPFWQDFQVDVDLCRHHNDAGLLGALYLAQNRDATSV